MRKNYNKTVQRHCCANIDGMLKNTKKGKLTFIDDERGRPMSDDRARMELYRLQAEGHEVIPTSNGCYRFDKKTGCPGHIKSLKPTSKALTEIEVEWSLYQNGLI